MYTANSPMYELDLYPSDDFYRSYGTSNPTIATIGAIATIALTSLCFGLYDFFVRREFLAKKNLLEAKRQFMRFVSHEVRTPLNSVFMGLAVLQNELAESLGYSSPQEVEGISLESISMESKGVPTRKDVFEWFELSRESNIIAFSRIFWQNI